MTDNEIIKALEEYEVVCDECACNEGYQNGKRIMSNALDLINRQKAEIDKCVNTLCKKEDTTQLIAKERQQYYDELQQANAEIERLNISHFQFISDINAYKEKLKTAKAEAGKELLEKLIKEYGHYTLNTEICIDTIFCSIKHIVKEMVGEG